MGVRLLLGMVAKETEYSEKDITYTESVDDIELITLNELYKLEGINDLTAFLPIMCIDAKNKEALKEIVHALFEEVLSALED